MTFRSMKRLVAGISLMAALAPLGSAQAATATVTKTIVSSTVMTEPTGSGAGFDRPPTTCTASLTSCFSKATVFKAQRCLYLTDKATAQDATTGKLGYVIGVASTWIGHRFTLKDVTGLAVDEDFDVVFYSKLGDCVSASQSTPAGDVAYGEAPEPNPAVKTEDSFTHIGDEAGTVPAGAKFAIVAMVGAPNGKFTLTIA